MKDIEKIKSEDLGCQVADANPGNFAIEQEVAQLVGATVPAPTEPSADDARELGAQLLVFLRRALLPIRSALRTALADLYAHLDSRCTDYPCAAYDPFRLPAGPYDPMRPFVPRTLPNLLTAITAFASRKISNGSATNDGIPDGMSLAHLMLSAETGNVLKLADDNNGWTLSKNPVSLFPNLVSWMLGCKDVQFYIPKLNTQAFISSKVENLDCPNLEVMNNTTTDGYGTAYSGWFNFANLASVNLPKLRTITGCLFWGGSAPEEVTLPSLVTAGRGVAQEVSGLKKLYCPELTTCPGYSYNPNLIAGCADLEEAYFPKLSSCAMYGTTGAGGTLQNLPKLRKLVIGKCNIVTANSWNTVCFSGCDSLIDLEIIGDLNQNLYLNSWNPTDKGTTFLQNFKEHICQRLANRTGQTKLTLTLSADVYTAIMTDNDIKAELVARNWKVTDGTNNYNN